MGVVGTTLAGRYRLERQLAEGGMGEVWVARHLALDVRVAVKLMGGAAAIRSNVRSRFELEAKAIAQLKSPHIVQIIDFGTEQGTPFMVMELLDGSDLLSLIPKRRLWPLAEIADIVTQVGKGLAVAHARGIIHRDIKPGNIFLSRSGMDTVIKLLDFGIAKWVAAEQNLTETDAVLGSPFYMSPEQVKGEVLDPRADLWSLSVVAYRLATGSLPFEGRDAIEVAERVMVGKWKPVPTSAPKPKELQRFFDKAFAERREDRYSDAKKLIEAFVAIAGKVTPAWTGDVASNVGENTVTIVKPRLSRAEEDASITEISQSLLLVGETEPSDPEVSTLPNDRQGRVARPAGLAEARAAASSSDTVTHPFAQPFLGAAPAPPPSHPGMGAPPPSHPGMGAPPPSSPGASGPPLGANGAYGYPPIPAGATPLPHGAPVAAWTTTQRIDHSDFLSTGKLEPPTLRRSVVMPELEPRRTANPGVIISLGLCGALVLGIVVWIAVNVAGQKGTANAQETSASAAQTTSPPPPPPPPAVAPTTAPVASVASATPSATTAPTAPRPVTAPKQPRPGKGKSPPSFLRPK